MASPELPITAGAPADDAFSSDEVVVTKAQIVEQADDILLVSPVGRIRQYLRLSVCGVIVIIIIIGTCNHLTLRFVKLGKDRIQACMSLGSRRVDPPTSSTSVHL